MDDNRFVLITGGTEGIGYELAKLYANDKKNVFIVARDEIKLQKIKEDLQMRYRVKVKILSVNLANYKEREKLIKHIEEKKMEIEVLINNAGVGTFGEFDKNNIENEMELIELNIAALSHLTHYFLKQMKDRNRGGILNIASTAAFSAGPKMANYYASKAYVLNLTEALHEESKNNNVVISCLCPGPVKTNFQQKAGIKKSEKAKSYLMSAEEVARIGYDGFKSKRVIIIPGLKNKLLVFGAKILPRSILRKIVMKTNC